MLARPWLRRGCQGRLDSWVSGLTTPSSAPSLAFRQGGGDSLGAFSTAALQSSSVAILQRLFADERAQSVTLAWLRPTRAIGDDQPTQDVILVVGMLRQTAQGVDWTHLADEDLRKVADLYREENPFR